MRYHALACDYDGTLASHGNLSRETAQALRRVRASGRRLLMVTGRQVDDLLAVCPDVGLFDRVVAENGAVIYAPASGALRALAEAPPPAMLEALRAAGVTPLLAGRVVVGTERPHDEAASSIIDRLGLDWRVIFNREAVMLLPSRVDKASGLAVALEEMGLSSCNVVAVGDAENDERLLAGCACGVAVGNAVPELKLVADLVTTAASGEGVVELIDRLVSSDLLEVASRLGRHDILLGTDDHGDPVRLPAYGATVVVAGSSPAASSAAAGLAERIAARGFQQCVVVPSRAAAPYCTGAILGDDGHAADPRALAAALDNPRQSAVVRLGAGPPAERARRFQPIFSQLLEMRARTGRPHWIVVDDAHSFFSDAGRDDGTPLHREDLLGLILVTDTPGEVSPSVLSATDAVVSVGASAGAMLRAFALAVSEPPPASLPTGLDPGDAIAWWRRRSDPPFRLRAIAAPAQVP